MENYSPRGPHNGVISFQWVTGPEPSPGNWSASPGHVPKRSYAAGMQTVKTYKGEHTVSRHARKTRHMRGQHTTCPDLTDHQNMLPCCVDAPVPAGVQTGKLSLSRQHVGTVRPF